MVNAINLLFAGYLQKLLVQRAGRFQVASKGLFNDDPAPAPILRFHQSHFSQVLDDGTEVI